LEERGRGREREGEVQLCLIIVKLYAWIYYWQDYCSQGRIIANHPGVIYIIPARVEMWVLKRHQNIGCMR